MLGFYDLVEATARPDELPDAGPVKFVKFLSEELVQGRIADRLLDSLSDTAGRDPQRVYAYAALMEAINNVRNHAYPDDRIPSVFPAVPRWWAAGSYDTRTQTLQFVVYDQGVGIPATLPKRPFFQAVRRFCPPEFNDADVIAGAIRYGRSRFLSQRQSGRAEADGEGRGNGLWAICKMIPELTGSSVRILSGHGEVTYSGKREVAKKVHDAPFCGTLIEWTLKLPSGANELGAST
ncbi:MAG TPA: hypothetical protein VIJ94_14690 [Caulobacteraceae bacterium]